MQGQHQIFIGHKQDTVFINHKKFSTESITHICIEIDLALIPGNYEIIIIFKVQDINQNVLCSYLT